MGRLWRPRGGLIDGGMVNAGHALVNAGIIRPHTVVAGDTLPVAGYTDWWISTERVYSDAGGTTPAVNGNNVENWTAGGSRGDALLETQAAKFVLVTNVINGRPAVQQPGAQTAELAVSYTQAQPFTVILAMYTVQFNSTFRIWGKGADGPQLWQHNTNPNISLYAGGSAACVSSFTLATWGIVSCVLDGAGSSIKVNNGSRTTGNPGTQGLTSFSIGQATNASLTYYAEIVIYPSALSAGDETAVMNAMNARYGIY